MTTEVTQTQQTPEAPKAPTISDPNLSFADYERLRRGESLPAPESTSAPVENETEQNEAGTSETPAKDEQEGEEHETESEAEGSEEEHEAKDNAKDEKPKKAKGGFQRRIDKLNAAKAAAQQEAEYWKREALKHATAPKDETPKVETNPSAAADGKPDPEKFATHGEYVEALTDWKAEQVLAKHSQKLEKSRLETEQKTALQSHLERVESFKATHDDFDEMMENLASVPRSPAIEQLIVGAENGPELLYELAKNPDEAARIAKLPPLAAAMEMGKFQSRLAARSSQAKPKEQKTTQAPKPLAPVTGGKAQAAKKTPEEMSFSEYEAYRNAQLKRR